MKVALFKFFLLLLTLSLPLVSAVNILGAFKGSFNKITGILDVESSKVRPFSTIDEVGPSRGLITGQEWATILQDPQAGFTTATHTLPHAEVQWLGRALTSFTSEERSYARNFIASEKDLLKLESQDPPLSREELRHASYILDRHAQQIKEYVARRFPQYNAEARRIEEMKLRTPVLWLAHEQMVPIGRILEEGVQDRAELNQLREELDSTRAMIDSTRDIVRRLQGYRLAGIVEDLDHDVKTLENLYKSLSARLSP